MAEAIPSTSTCDPGGNCLHFIRDLDRGTFGIVKLYRTCNGERFCLKQIAYRNGEAFKRMIENELYIHSSLIHPRIIQYIDYFIGDITVNITLEFAPLGSLRDIICTRRDRFSESEVLKFFIDILMGLEYLYIRRVIHRDLKPENLLIGADERIKISDFGIATVALREESDETTKHFVGSPLYAAPEVFANNEYSYKTDIWALGCIFYEMCWLRNPFEIFKSEGELRNFLISFRRPFFYCKLPSNFSSYEELQHNMLTFNPAMRISIKDIIRDQLIMLRFYDGYFNHYSDNLS